MQVLILEVSIIVLYHRPSLLHMLLKGEIHTGSSAVLLGFQPLQNGALWLAFDHR